MGFVFFLFSIYKYKCQGYFEWNWNFSPVFCVRNVHLEPAVDFRPCCCLCELNWIRAASSPCMRTKIKFGFERSLSWCCCVTSTERFGTSILRSVLYSQTMSRCTLCVCVCSLIISNETIRERNRPIEMYAVCVRAHVKTISTSPSHLKWMRVWGNLASSLMCGCCDFTMFKSNATTCTGFCNNYIFRICYMPVFQSMWTAHRFWYFICRTTHSHKCTHRQTHRIGCAIIVLESCCVCVCVKCSYSLAS